MSLTTVSRVLRNFVRRAFALTALACIVGAHCFGSPKCTPTGGSWPVVNNNCTIPISLASGGTLQADVDPVYVWSRSLVTWSQPGAHFHIHFTGKRCFTDNLSDYDDSMGAATPAAAIKLPFLAQQDCPYDLYPRAQQEKKGSDPKVIIVGSPGSPSECKKLTGDDRKKCVEFFRELKHHDKE